MALVRTTASTAIAATDKSITVASATGFAAGYFVRMDEEIAKVAASYTSGTIIPLIRGIDGTRVVAHAITCSVVCGTGADWSNPEAQTVDSFLIAGRARSVTSYTADGAITHPVAGSDAVAILNGTTQWDMTLAVPGKDLDGSVLIIVGNGKAAHTVTVTGGIGAASTGYTVLTFDTGGQCAVQLIAANEVWVPLPSPLSGTLTAVDVAVS